MAPHLSLFSWLGAIPSARRHGSRPLAAARTIPPGSAWAVIPRVPWGRGASRAGVSDVRSPSRGSQGPGLKSNRLQVNLGISPAWTRSRFPSRNILFASGQSIMIFRNKKTHSEGKADYQLRFKLVGIQISNPMGIRSL